MANVEIVTEEYKTELAEFQKAGDPWKICSSIVNQLIELIHYDSLGLSEADNLNKEPSQHESSDTQKKPSSKVCCKKCRY